MDMVLIFFFEKHIFFGLILQMAQTERISI